MCFYPHILRPACAAFVFLPNCLPLGKKFTTNLLKRRMLLTVYIVVRRFQDPRKPRRYYCCSNVKLIKDGYLVCKNCGKVHDCLTANKSVDIYENMRRIRKKSIYHRKYHILNVITDIAQKNRIQIGYCPRRDFAQKAKSRGGTLVTRAYIKESTYS